MPKSLLLFFFCNQSYLILTFLLLVFASWFIKTLSILRKYPLLFRTLFFTLNCLSALKWCFLKKVLYVVKLMNLVIFFNHVIFRNHCHMQTRIINPPTFSSPEWPWSSLPLLWFPKSSPRSKADHRRAPTQQLAGPWTQGPDTREHRAITERKWDLTEWVVRSFLCTHKELQKNLQLCPSGIHPERDTGSACNPLAHSCTHAKEMGLWHHLEHKPAADILDDGHL